MPQLIRFGVIEVLKLSGGGGGIRGVIMKATGFPR